MPVDETTRWDAGMVGFAGPRDTARLLAEMQEAIGHAHGLKGMPPDREDMDREAERLAALIDFTFNLGASRPAGSTLRRRVNARDWAAVPAELRKWVRGGGRVLKGLKIRRGAEIALM